MIDDAKIYAAYAAVNEGAPAAALMRASAASSGGVSARATPRAGKLSTSMPPPPCDAAAGGGFAGTLQRQREHRGIHQPRRSSFDGPHHGEEAERSAGAEAEQREREEGQGDDQHAAASGAIDPCAAGHLGSDLRRGVYCVYN